MLSPMVTAEWLHLYYCTTEYHNSRQSIIILVWQYLVDIGSEAWLNIFREYINGKLFAVLYVKIRLASLLSVKA